jgi:hypothetical protein
VSRSRSLMVSLKGGFAVYGLVIDFDARIFVYTTTALMVFDAAVTRPGKSGAKAEVPY